MAIGGEARPKDLARHVKTNRAFRAYIDLMDAADWLRGEMSDQLATFDLTMMQFSGDGGPVSQRAAVSAAFEPEI